LKSRNNFRDFTKISIYKIKNDFFVLLKSKRKFTKLKKFFSPTLKKTEMHFYKSI